MEEIIKRIESLVADCDRLAAQKKVLLARRERLEKDIEKVDEEFNKNKKLALDIANNYEVLDSFADLVTMAKFEQAINEVMQES